MAPSIRTLCSIFVVLFLVACGRPNGGILEVVDRNGGPTPLVTGPDGTTSDGPGRTPTSSGDGDGDVTGDGDGDGDGDRDGTGGDGDGDGDGDPDPPPPPPPPPDPVPPLACPYEWMYAPMAYPPDPLVCFGETVIRYDSLQLLWVGVVLCDEPEGYQRVYLSDEQYGEYLPTTDWAGGGQDHCELVNGDFWIEDEDDINSGNCANCYVGQTSVLENQPTWVRGFYGQQFEPVFAGPMSSFQASQLYCGVDPRDCAYFE